MGEQVNRFTEAIKARNACIKLYGQEEVIHRCKKCTRIYKGEDGQRIYAIYYVCGTKTDIYLKATKSVWVAVMDGVTLGHPCCAFHNCKVPLTTSRDRYCVIHCGLSNICSIKGCSEPILKGKKTCSNLSHQEVERVYILRGESRVQLQEKLKRQHVSHPNDGIAEDVDLRALIDDEEEEEFEVDEGLVHGINDGISDL
jgi:hypothetical protein